MNSEYIRYLKSPEWREKRKQFLEIVNYECEICGSKNKLQVHHLNYNNIGEEEKEDVQVLCKDCHKDKEIEKGTDLSYGDEYGEY
jgi:5-methylcytosine-specific restriction endonuclease McrA